MGQLCCPGPTDLLAAADADSRERQLDGDAKDDIMFGKGDLPPTASQGSLGMGATSSTKYLPGGEDACDDDDADLPNQFFQVRLGANWSNLGEEELLQVRRGIAKGQSSMEVTSRGQRYTIDLDAMKQTNAATGKARELREVDEDGNEVVNHSLYIHEKDLGPPCDAFAQVFPDWQWDTGSGTLKSYGLEDSMELDRYWQIYCGQQEMDTEVRYLARLRLARKSALVNFRDMTAQVGTGKPRRIERRLLEADWLNNRYFFKAFTNALEKAGVHVESSPETMFDYRFNQDFRNLEDDGRTLSRGGQDYRIPFGWKRFAVNVKGQYDDGDNKWLKDDQDGWAVAYHGTEDKNLPGILATGFRIGPRQKFEKECGKGVYCTPDLDLAARYAKALPVEGHTVRIVLQMRVKPSAIRKVTQDTNWDYEKDYWVINDPTDIRAYGVLIRGEDKT